MVTFSSNNKTANIRADQTILELSKDLVIGFEISRCVDIWLARSIQEA